MLILKCCVDFADYFTLFSRVINTDALKKLLVTILHFLDVSMLRSFTKKGKFWGQLNAEIIITLILYAVHSFPAAEWESAHQGVSPECDTIPALLFYRNSVIVSTMAK